jgi:hypothetical protein
VLSATGTWEINGRAVKQGEGVPRGAHLTLRSGTVFPAAEPYAIHIVLLNNEPKSLTCSTAQECRPGLTLPASLTAETSLASRLLDVFHLIFEKPERYVGLMSRGADDTAASFVDGLARLAGGRLALAPFFQTLPAGAYRLRFERVAPQTSPPAPSFSADVRWTQGAESASLETALAPALYRVTLSRPADPVFSDREAWWLVVPDDRFDAAKAAFDHAVAASRAWGPDVPPRDLAIFRHAFLTELATHAQ